MNFIELEKLLDQQAAELAKSLAAPAVDTAAVAAAEAAAKAKAIADAAAGTASPMIKSFSLVLEDGTVMEAQDATEMVKCLVDEINLVKGEVKVGAEQMFKSLGGTVELITTLTEGLKATRQDVVALAEQNKKLVAANAEMAKSLETFGGTGRGRRSVDVVLGDRPNLNGGAGGGGAGAGAAYTPQEIMAKAQSALTAGTISATEATKIETAINMSIMPDKAILAHLFKA